MDGDHRWVEVRVESTETSVNRVHELFIRALGSRLRQEAANARDSSPPRLSLGAGTEANEGDAVFGWRRQRPELTESLRLQAEHHRVLTPPPAPARSFTQPQEAEVAKFLADLRPNQQLTFDSPTAQARHDAAARLAPRPLTAGLEHTASALARAIVLANEERRTGHEGFAIAEVKAIGLRLGAQGGGFLMVLVSHRAQYLADPDWKAKRAEMQHRLNRQQEEGPRVVVMTSVGGPLVSLIERYWAGICGWER